MSNHQQWPSHQRKLYNTVTSKNHQKKNKMSDDQRSHLARLWETKAEIHADLLMTTDYPDDLADVISEQKVIDMVLKS